MSLSTFDVDKFLGNLTMKSPETYFALSILSLKGQIVLSCEREGHESLARRASLTLFHPDPHPSSNT